MTESRLRILDDGSLEVVDPRWEDVALLRAVEPGFEIRTAPLPGFSEPRIRAMRRLGCGAELVELAVTPAKELWRVHETALNRWRSDQASERAPGESSILDLKYELARRLLARCVLCARRCGANRAAGRPGFCGLEAEAVLAESFIHIGEEPPINPSHLFSLAGCALRCRFCQQSALLTPAAVRGTRLEAEVWKDVDIQRARSVSFIGGNPDESLPAILGFLRSAPIDFPLPVVWNTHAYASPEALTLLDGVVDVYLPDLKYGNDRCAERWSHAGDYYSVAQQTLDAMTTQGVLVIVRILVLPGHLDCCHVPALKFLASLARPPLLSIRGQYRPDWLIDTSDGLMNERISQGELARAMHEARSLGLSQIAP